MALLFGFLIQYPPRTKHCKTRKCLFVSKDYSYFSFVSCWCPLYHFCSKSQVFVVNFDISTFFCFKMFAIYVNPKQDIGRFFTVPHDIWCRIVTIVYINCQLWLLSSLLGCLSIMGSRNRPPGRTFLFWQWVIPRFPIDFPKNLWYFFLGEKLWRRHAFPERFSERKPFGGRLPYPCRKRYHFWAVSRKWLNGCAR